MKATQHTTVNVSIIDEAFYMPQLQRTRRIWMYTPDGYHHSTQRYPVIYMHDGQNLFDEATAFDNEWQIDETLKSLSAACIVIGIDNSGYRMLEYNYYNNKVHGLAEGKAYIDFIVNSLKPYIDNHYKTLPGRYNTFMAGSSMGGLITLFGALNYPEVFGKAGVFSPALWVVPNLLHEIEKLAKGNSNNPQQFYFYGGDNEAGNTVKNILDTADVLKRYPLYKTQVSIDAEGEHCELCWRDKFSSFYKWLCV